MRQIVYRRYDPDELSLEERFQNLKSLYHYLLLVTSGDVRKAVAVRDDRSTRTTASATVDPPATVRA